MRDLPTCSTCGHHVDVHAVPGPGLHGRQHARTVIGRLREVAGAGDGDGRVGGDDAQVGREGAFA